MGESTRFIKYLQTTGSIRYPPEELFRTFLKLFWKTSNKTPLKESCFNNDEDSRPGNFLKTQSYRVKTMTYAAYMLKIISLTGTVYNHEFWQNCFVRGWSNWMSFICVQNCSILWILVTEFNDINLFLFQKGNHIQSTVKHLRWSVL